MKVNFRIIEVQVSFEGEKRVFDIAREIGNMMMYNGSILLDIGFEDLARATGDNDFQDVVIRVTANTDGLLVA